MDFLERKTIIVHVIESLEMGGREKTVVDIANGLDKNLFDVHIITFSNDANTQITGLHKNVSLHEMPFKRNDLGGLSAIRFWQKGMPLYKKLLRKINPGIVHTHLLFQLFLFGSRGIKYAGIRAKHFHTVQISGLYFSEGGIRNKLRLWVEQKAVSLNHAYISCVSQHALEKCTLHFNKYASAIRLIYNSVDETKLKRFLKTEVHKGSFGLKQDDIMVTYVARMDEGKDHITLLKGWKEIAPLNNHVKLCLVGDGITRLVLERYVHEHQLGQSVIFMGTLSNLQPVLSVTDIGVFTSLFEGFSIALAEKMIMGIPVVASDIPAISSLIKDNDNGFLFPPRNHQVLAQKLLLLIQNPVLRQKMGERAYQSAQPYTLKEMIKNYTAFYGSAATD